MGLKQYLFPLFLLLFVYFAIMYISPSVTAVSGKIALKKTTQDKLHATELTVKNIGSLSGGLAGNAGSGKVYSFLPSSVDHDLVMDKLNYIAVQDGVTIAGFSFTETLGGQSTVAVQAPADAAASGSVLSTDTSATALAPPTASPGTYSVSIDMSGSYESMRTFLSHISALDRMNVVTGFSIDATPKDATSTDVTKPVNGDFLGTMKLDFSYLPKTTYANAYLLPVFETGTIDTKSADALLAKLNGVQPMGDQAVSGRPNPFKH